MDLKVYQDIIRVLTPEMLSTLQAYADAKIDQLRLKMDTVDNFDEIRKIQGAISELKVLKRIRENAILVLKE